MNVRCPRQQWLLYTSRYVLEKMKEERSKILWNKITNCWNLQEAVNFEYRRRMPTVSPMCHESGTEPWQSKTATIAATTTTTKRLYNDNCNYNHKNYSNYNNYKCNKTNKTNKNPQLTDNNNQQPTTTCK